MTREAGFALDQDRLVLNRNEIGMKAGVLKYVEPGSIKITTMRKEML